LDHRWESSFFILCSLRQLAKDRGGYRYILKLEKTPKDGQMLIGFLQSPSDSPAALGPEFVNVDPVKGVLDLDQFAKICAISG
jgi:hypothetical protein